MIINQLALIINNFINELYLLNINFYMIIISLVIFNFIIYHISNFIIISKYRR